MSGPEATGGWDALRRKHPRTLTFLSLLIAVLVIGNLLLAARVVRYRSETQRLRAGMSDAERQRADMVESSEQNRMSVEVELLRRQAAVDVALHLSVSVDSGVMRLQRDGALLREMPVHIGGAQLVGTAPDTLHIVPPRGSRSIERILGARDRWEVPAWVFTERGMAVPSERAIQGVLGRDALLLTGGTVIYAPPDSGLLSDSSYVIPGTVRLSRADLRAIAPNVTPGVTVYFYE
jgi:hypothetical protein